MALASEENLYTPVLHGDRFQAAALAVGQSLRISLVGIFDKECVAVRPPVEVGVRLSFLLLNIVYHIPNGLASERMRAYRVWDNITVVSVGFWR